MHNEIPDFEKQKAVAEYEKRQDKMEARGRIIITIIVVVNIVFSILFELLTLKPMSFSITLALSIGLYFGVPWIRYFYAIIAIFGVFNDLSYLLGGLELTSLGITIAIISIAYKTVCCVLFFSSKSATEFLYGQRNG